MSIVLMMLETRRYVLFNIFTVKPLISADLLEAAGFHRSPKQENSPSYCRLLLLSLDRVSFTNRLVGRPLYRLTQKKHQSIA
jgi:hypothetical protein